MSESESISNEQHNKVARTDALHGATWSCGYCFVPNNHRDLICRSCKKQKTTKEELNRKHIRHGNIFMHWFLGALMAIIIAIEITLSIGLANGLLLLLLSWWGGLIFFVANNAAPPEIDYFSHTKEVAGKFIGSIPSGLKKPVDVIYKIIYFPIFFQKTVSLFLVAAALVYLFHLLKHN